MADWIDLGALSVAATAAILARQALKSDAQDRRTAVRPYIAFYRHAHEVEKSIALTMKSAGVGPAIISGYALYFDNRQILADNQEELRGIAGVLQVTLERPYFLGRISPGSVFAQGESLPLVKFSVRPQFERQMIDIRSIAKRFDAVVTYRSVFEDQIFEAKSVDSPW